MKCGRMDEKMATKHRLIPHIFLISILGAFLFGCSTVKTTPLPEQMDESPFTGSPCAAPCWQGLWIGESSESDVMAMLPTLTFIKQETIQVFDRSMPTLDLSTFAPGVEIRASCSTSFSQQCLSIDVVDNVLTEVTLFLNYEIRADEAIGYLGWPDYVGYQDLGAEKIICGVYLVWRDKQLILTSSFEGGKAYEENCGVVRDTGKVASDFLVSEIRYVSSAEIEYLLSNNAGFFEFSGTIPDDE